MMKESNNGTKGVKITTWKGGYPVDETGRNRMRYFLEDWHSKPRA
jgi:hypothetical protein